MTAAQAPKPTSDQPIGHQISRQCLYLPKQNQKCIFWVKIAVFWVTHPNFFGREQRFWYPPIRKPPWHLICIVFRSAVFGPKCFFLGREQNFWYPQIWEPIRPHHCGTLSVVNSPSIHRSSIKIYEPLLTIHNFFVLCSFLSYSHPQN